jgi:sugar lactone lactonase YvrE
MKPTVSALIILLIPLFAAPYAFPDPTASAGGPGAAAPDSASVAAPPDTVRSVRIEETPARFGAGDLREPTGIAADARGYVYVADAMAGKVFRYAPDGSSAEFERPPDNAGYYPIDLAVLESFVLVLDYSRNALLRYDFRGAYLDVLLAFDQFDRMRPVSVSASAGGSIIACDVASQTVALWTPLLDLELVIGGFGRGEGRFNEPRKAAFLPGQRIVTVESLNRRLQFL